MSTNPEGPGGGQGGGQGVASSNAKEAPLLAKQVKEGSLPPLEKRLPPEPVVVRPVERPGSYGGTWHLFNDNPPLGGGSEVYYDWLVRWSPDWKKIQPNLAKSWEVADGGRQYTFQLVHGVKWSDGKDFTADDIVFAYDDVLLNKDLFEVPPVHFLTSGKPGKIEKLDDYSFRWTFAEPNGLFMEYLASAGPHVIETCPRHYFAQFLPKHNPQADKDAKKNGYKSWYEQFVDKGGPAGWTGNIWQPEVPVLTAWRTTGLERQGSRMVMERNPYYWKTDTKGRQLPYLDRQVLTALDHETALLQATNGELEFLHPTFYNPNICTPDNKPVLARSRAKGKYRFVDGLSSTMSWMVIAFNLTHQDPKMREVFQNRDFRIGMSYAINRKEIIDGVYQRQGEAWQAAPRKESEFFYERLAKQYTEYDPDKANEHLDKAGFTKRDSNGIRLRADGKPIFFQVDVITQEPTEINSLELIKQYWQKVGIRMELKTMDRDLFYTRKAANKHDANVWTGDGGLRDGLIDPRWYMAANGESNFALPWATWYGSDGADGEKPPAIARKQMDLYDQLARTIDSGKRRQLFRKILEIAADQFWVIGTVLPVGVYGIQRNDFHNVPRTTMIASWRYPTPGPSHPEQFFTTDM